MRGLRFAAVVAVLAVGLGRPGAAEPMHAPGGVIRTLQVGAETRTYRLEVPPEARGAKLPVIVFLHGADTDITTPIKARYDIPFETLPGLGPAVIVRPQGRGGRWNSGPGSVAGVDDVAFLRALIDQVVADDHGDPDRVYVSGVSAGGSMTIRVACEMSDKVAAVAAVLTTARASLLPACASGRPIPFLLMASTTDPAVPYRGGAPWGGMSAPETVALFMRRNGCSVRREEPLPHEDVRVDSSVALVRYSGCTDGADVLFYRVDGSGHSVPSRDPAEPGDWAENGARNRDINTVAVIWDFWRGRGRR